MSSPPAWRLGDDAPDDESGASSAGPGAFGPPGRKNVGAPLVGKSPNAAGSSKMSTPSSVVRHGRHEIRHEAKFVYFVSIHKNSS